MTSITVSRGNLYRSEDGIAWVDPTQLRDGATKLAAYRFHDRHGPCDLVRSARWNRLLTAWTDPYSDRILDPQPYAVAKLPIAPPHGEFE